MAGSMSHVYQPLVVHTLVDSDDVATLRQLAVALVSQRSPPWAMRA
jgi:hypothetical protein